MISEYAELGRSFLRQCSECSGFKEYDVPQEMVEEIGKRIYHREIHYNNKSDYGNTDVHNFDKKGNNHY